MNKKNVFIAFAVFTLCAGLTAKADPARVMNYQGRITDSNGVPVADGAYDITFKIYDALSGGTLLWTEAHTGASQVTITDGLFSATLGEITGLISFTSGAFYIETTVGATVYSPRARITGSSTAVNADLIDGYHAGNASGNVPVSNGTVNTNLNSDLLDGADESAFFKLADNETVSGIPAFNGGTSGSTAPFTADSTFVVTNLNADLLDGNHAAAFMTAAADNWVNTTGDTMTGQLTNTYNSGSPFVITSTTVNTNLNADMVDGKHYSDATSDFVNISGDTMTGRLGQSASGFHAADKDDLTTRTNSGFYQTSSATTGEAWPVTSNSWYHLLSVTHTNDANYYAMQFAADFFSNTLYYRSSNCGATTGCTTGWNKIWHDGNDANAGSWTLSGSSLYPDSTTYNVAIGASAPAVKLHVTGNTFIDTTGNAAVDRTVTIKTTGQGQLNFGSYPGAWTSALQIQSNDNTRQIWISPLDNASGYNARIRTGATGLDIYTNGTAVDTGTFAASFSSGELVAASFRTPTSGYGSGAALDAGDVAVDYPGSSGWAGSWNSNILLSGLNSTSISFHDSGASVATFRYTGNNFYIGENVGWGVSNLNVGGNINLSGQLQADKVCYFTSAFTVNGSTTNCAAGYCVNAVVNDATKNVMAAGDYNQRGVTQFGTGRLECCRCSISYP